jgi:hypothetical protein
MSETPFRPGCFAVCLVRGGPRVAARIHFDQDLDIWRVTVGGEDHARTWASAELAEELCEALMNGRTFSHPLFRVALFGEPIDQAEHDFLLKRAAWAREHDPESPAARPDRPINLGTLPPLY